MRLFIFWRHPPLYPPGHPICTVPIHAREWLKIQMYYVSWTCRVFSSFQRKLNRRNKVITKPIHRWPNGVIIYDSRIAAHWHWHIRYSTRLYWKWEKLNQIYAIHRSISPVCVCVRGLSWVESKWYFCVINHLFRVYCISRCWHKINNNAVNIAFALATHAELSVERQIMSNKPCGCCRRRSEIEIIHWLGLERKFTLLCQGSRCFTETSSHNTQEECRRYMEWARGRKKGRGKNLLQNICTWRWISMTPISYCALSAHINPKTE